MKTAAFTDLATRIEIYLNLCEDWVSVETICRECGVTERILRADGKRRPIYGRFAISSSIKGLKHIRHTTVSERLTYKHARKKVIVAHARALKEFTLALHDALTGKHPQQHEILTGQGTLFGL